MVRLATHVGEVQVQLDGFKSRGLRAQAPAHRHLYATAWCTIEAQTAGVSTSGMLMLDDGEARLADPGRLDRCVGREAPALHGSELPAAVVAVTTSRRSSGALVPLAALEEVLSVVQAQAAMAASPPSVWLLAAGVQVGLLQVGPAGWWGLARSARAEVPSLLLFCMDAMAVAAIACGSLILEPEAVLDAERVHVPRLAHTSGFVILNAPHGAGSHMISGGTGGLGVLTARWLAQQGSRAVALASRSGALARDASAEWAQLQATDVVICAVQCDTANVAHVQRLAALMMPCPTTGVWHAAGLLADSTLSKQTGTALALVYGPKAHGAWVLQRMTVGVPLVACVLFSSVMALLGGAGQASYSAANTCLDVLASRRRACSQAAVSVQWGAWAEVGMAARGAASKRMVAMEAASGFGRIAPAQGLAALGMVLSLRCPSLLGMVPVQWDRMLGDGTNVPAFLSGMTPLSSSGPTMQRMQVARRGAISGVVLAEQPAFDEPLAPYEVEVQVQAVGLNFRDVLLVLGEYPGPPAPTGTDCAGIVTAIGELAAHARHDELFGLADGCLEHFVRARTHVQLMVRRPSSITAAEACTLPTTWNTVHEVLRRSVLRSEQTFLLHAAAGGVGLVCIEYLSWLGASDENYAYERWPLRGWAAGGVQPCVPSDDVTAADGTFKRAQTIREHCSGGGGSSRGCP